MGMEGGCENEILKMTEAAASYKLSEFVLQS